MIYSYDGWGRMTSVFNGKEWFTYTYRPDGLMDGKASANAKTTYIWENGQIGVELNRDG
jgi:hypothetical protein